MTSNEIRTRFLKFFESRGHRVVRSSSLVPANDPTLLFTNAGMNQFKDVFLGREKRDHVRACSSQKCVRAGGKHNDLEQVGRTRRHHTFFEMLGNFSFGDYFKAEAIPWAWELVTKDFAIPKEKLYVTIFEGLKDAKADIPRDSEAYDLWRSVGVPKNRIFELGMHDNFWAMGDTGPCGPCSEIHYDMGPEASDLGHADCKFPCDCGRFVEIWNLVFMQYDRVSVQKQVNQTADFEDHELAKQQFVETGFRLLPLPKPCVDTGAGLERMAAVLQGKVSNFDTDLFKPLIDEAAALANVEYDAGHETDVSLRIIADHARAATFLISDGVLPSNEGRDYVLRKIMRRAIMHGRKLGLQSPFLYRMSGHVCHMMKSAYPELLQSEHRVSTVIKSEEARFAGTLGVGLTHLNSRLDGLVEEKKFAIAPRKDLLEGASEVFGPELAERAADDLKRSVRAQPSLKGDVAFKLYDTYGLPLDFIEDVANSRGIIVDKTGFEQALQRQRERARASWKGQEKKAALPIYQELAERARTHYDPYMYPRMDGCRVVAIVCDGLPIEQVTAGREPKQVQIVLDKTPFYAEAGGQLGDTGQLIEFATQKTIASVVETFSPAEGIIAHKAVLRGSLRVGAYVTAVIDAERRDAIRRNHTATHLLHAALRTTLGTHVKQAGSLVAPDRLRFDFSHYAELGEQDILDIEDLVNQHILKNEEVRTGLMEIDQALATGAMALFGEKYGDRVRVLSVDDGSFSRELCGGTHVSRTGDIGLFKIVSEGSVAAGTRRIEAITGLGVLEHIRKADETLEMVGETLRAKPGGVLEAAQKLAEAEKRLRKELDAQQMKRAAAQAGDLLDQARDVKGVQVVSARVEGVSRPAMRQMVDQLRARLGSGVIALGAVADGKAALIIGVTQDLTAKLDAGKIVRQAAALMEGSGGGRKDLAEAGGKNPEKLDECVQAVPSIIEKML
jgi:alanyl-tRNA synthetase